MNFVNVFANARAICRKLFNSRYPRRVLGIDITPFQIKAIQIYYASAHCVEIETCMMIALPPSAVDTQGRVQPDLIAQAFKQLQQHFILSQSQIVMAVPDSCVKQNIISLPNTANLEQAIEEIADRVSDWPSTERYLDFQSKGFIGDLHRRVFFAFVPKTFVDERIQALALTDNVVNVVDIESKALMRCLQFFDVIEKEQPCLIIQVNALFIQMFYANSDDMLLIHQEHRVKAFCCDEMDITNCCRSRFVELVQHFLKSQSEKQIIKILILGISCSEKWLRDFEQDCCFPVQLLLLSEIEEACPQVKWREQVFEQFAQTHFSSYFTALGLALHGLTA